METTSPVTPGLQTSDLSRIAQDLQIKRIQVENVVQLLDDGNTVPFITRYRKERTGGLDEEKIRRVQSRVEHLRELIERKQTILKSIDSQGKLTETLRDAIITAESMKRLDDLYLPYKPKKTTLATQAREKGLEPLALAIWNRDEIVADLNTVVAGMIDPEKNLNSVEDIMLGTQHILAEMVSETAELRAAVRHVVWETGKLVAKKTDQVTAEKGVEYKDYYEFEESARMIPPHRVLAVNRGEKEKFLTISIQWDHGRARDAAKSQLTWADHPHREVLEKALEDALERLINPAMEREVRREQTEAAQEHAVAIFARNLRSLLLQPPLRTKRVLAIDPGFRTGCKVAAIDETGKLHEESISVIYPNEPQKKADYAKRKLEELIRKYQINVIAIGNGTACRETETVVSELLSYLEAKRKDPAAYPDVEPEPAHPEPVTAESTEPAEPVVGVPSSAAEVVEPTAEAVPRQEHSEQPLEKIVPAEVPVPTETQETPAAPPEPSDAVPSEPVAETETPAVDTAATEATPISEPAPTPEVETRPAHEGRKSGGGRPQPPKIILEGLPLPPEDLAYVIVNEAGASDYSASQVAREEFPNFDATTRGTISIGRRLQDPLAELVKIDPQHVGVGLYQHDVKAKFLKESLESIVESCVNHVGVDLNTASVPLLRNVSGLNAMVARDLVTYRDQNGPFKSRDQLKSIPGIGEKRYEQAAGFLKLTTSEDPLDATWIHPESYSIARQVLTDLGFAVEDLKDAAKLGELREKLNTVDIEEVAKRLNAPGVATIKDIFDSLARPGRDPREDLPPPIFKKGILKLEDLSNGMELKGTVLNVVDFGAFVDIGLKDSGLVHISQMANRYIKSPYDVVAVGDVVTVWVMKVEQDRRRVSLTMIAPGTERTRQEPPPRGVRPEGGDPARTGERGGFRGGERAERGDRPVAPGTGEGQQSPQRGGDRRPAGGGDSRGGDRRPAFAPRPQGGQGQGGNSRFPRGGPPQRQNNSNQDTGSQQGSAQTGPPRKPAKPKPLPKLSQDALSGRKPLHTFGELEAFFKAKEPTPEPVKPVEETPPENTQKPAPEDQGNRPSENPPENPPSA
jgi:protein Tex